MCISICFETFFDALTACWLSEWPRQDWITGARGAQKVEELEELEDIEKLEDQVYSLYRASHN